MVVYADTPRWPRHGMLWGHMISDSSLQELHAAADRAGLHPRSFDLDHYDWPEAAAPHLDAAGVVRVGNADLTRILLRSGLRIPARERPLAAARRTVEHARQLGLSSVPTDLIWGRRGHVGPLPAQAPAGAFRLVRNLPTAAPDAERDLRADETAPAWGIETRDAAGRRRAERCSAELDRLARERGYTAFIGQVLTLMSDAR